MCRSSRSPSRRCRQRLGERVVVARLEVLGQARRRHAARRADVSAAVRISRSSGRRLLLGPLGVASRLPSDDTQRRRPVAASDQGQPLLAAGQVLVAAADGVLGQVLLRVGPVGRRPAPGRPVRRGRPGRGSSRRRRRCRCAGPRRTRGRPARRGRGRRRSPSVMQAEHDVEAERPLQRVAVVAEAGHAAAAPTPRPGRRRAPRRRRGPAPPGRRRCGRGRGAPARPPVAEVERDAPRRRSVGRDDLGLADLVAVRVVGSSS